MKLLLAFISCFMGVTSPQPISQTSASIVAQTCYVYQTPSFESVLQVEGKDITLNHGDEIEVLEEVDDFVKIEVKLSEQSAEGFVYRYYITYNDNQQETYPVFNAKIESASAIVYDLEKNETEIKLKKGQGVYLYSGYDKKQEWTAVCFVHNDQSLYYGFVKTLDISPDGINPWLLTGAVIIFSCVTLVFLLVFMKKKQKDKKD